MGKAACCGPFFEIFSSGDWIVKYATVNIGHSEVTTTIMIGEALVVEPRQVQKRSLYLVEIGLFDLCRLAVAKSALINSVGEE